MHERKQIAFKAKADTLPATCSVNCANVLGKTLEQRALTTTNAQVKFEATTTSKALKRIHFQLSQKKNGHANKNQNKFSASLNTRPSNPEQARKR
jgi:hypothetical protein